jgi:hypothetical protein
MLKEPICYKRKCKWFEGAKWLGDQENTEVVYCKAYPDGIPSDIAYGDDLHTEIRSDQKGDYKYEQMSYSNKV